jgi:two-component sensor histidine kinase
MALARAHDLLTKRHWQHAPLGTLVREVLAPLAGEGAQRARIDGPSLNLDPRAALSLTMALSELATNAAKYGALSTATGTVSVAWRVHQGSDRTTLRLDWQELGGPDVRPPTRRGFGTRLMERCIERDLEGELDLVFEPRGVHCRMTIPFAEQERE